MGDEPASAFDHFCLSVAARGRTVLISVNSPSRVSTSI